jgi:hypothetical protein
MVSRPTDRAVILSAAKDPGLEAPGALVDPGILRRYAPQDDGLDGAKTPPPNIERIPC